jgi:hypothetical protein
MCVYAKTIARRITLLFLFWAAIMQGQKKEKSSIVYSRANDTSGIMISWKNLTVMPMNISKMRELIDSAYIEGSEGFLGHHVNSIFAVSEKDLRTIRRTTGRKINWEVYIDFSNFRQTNMGYYIWLVSKKKSG